MDTPEHAPRAEARGRILSAACMAACAVAILYFGPAFLGSFRPEHDSYMDFVQEWLSARSFWAGEPVYQLQRSALLRHTGQDVPAFDSQQPWNAHPPAAVLVSLPLGRVSDYATAHLLWNLVTFPLFVAGLVLAARELGVRARWGPVAAAVALTVSWGALQNQLAQGQFNTVILFLLVVAWVADRRGLQVAAGVAVGLAAALKVFPALLLVYFAAAGRWRAAAAAVLACLLLNGLALVLFGPGAFETYVRDVLPSLEAFRYARNNVSLAAYWTRAGAALGSPAAGALGAVLSQLAVVGAVWWAGRRAASGAGDHDRAFALAVAGMPLASPVAWMHYFVLLALPLLLLWRRLPRGLVLGVFFAAGAVLWAPQQAAPELYRGWFTYALVAVFLLVEFARLTPAPVTRQSP